MWFAAHVVMKVEFKSGDQGRYPVWENVYLVEASDDSEAWQKDTGRHRAGAEFAVDLVSLPLQRQNANLLFLGIDDPILWNAGARIFARFDL